MMGTVEFLPSTHTYVVDNIVVPSVSDILRYIFPDQFKGIPRSVLQAKAGYGTLLHKAIECHETGELLPPMNYIAEAGFNQYLKLREKHILRIKALEQIVSYKGLYAGRFDMYAIRKNYPLYNPPALIDIKTSAKLDKDYLSWQLSYYALAFDDKDEDSNSVDELFCIWLPKKELGKFVQIKRKSDDELLSTLEDFLEVWRSKHEIPF